MFPVDAIETVAELLAKLASMGVGQWWEQVGGPHLAKGGNHETFKKLMEEEGLSSGVQEKFMRVAQQKYPPGHNLGRGAAQEARRSSSVGDARRRAQERAQQAYGDAWSETRARWAREDAADAKTRAESWAKQDAEWAAANKATVRKKLVGAAINAAPFIAAGLYSTARPDKEDPHTRVPKWQGRLANYIASAGTIGSLGSIVGSMRGGKQDALIGAGLGALAGAAIGEWAHQADEQHAQEAGEKAFRTGKDKKLLRESAKTQAYRTGQVALGTLPLGIVHALDSHNPALSALLHTGIIFGGGLANKRLTAAAVEHLDHLRGKKKAASVGEKTALVERLARLAATDIPGTPRLLMRHRSPQELAQLQHGVSSAFQRVQEPVRQAVGKLTSKLPGMLQKPVQGAANLAIDHPEIIPMQAVPIPGLTPGYLAAKRGAEKLIDRFAPAAKLAASAPTRGNFMMASDIPSFRPPRLDQAIQKNSGETTMPLQEPKPSSSTTQDNPSPENTGKQSDFLPDGVTYNASDFKRSKYAMSTEKLAEVTDWLLKQAEPGITPAGRLASTMRVGAPKVSAPPGPSIADQVKPRGAHFGLGIPGALKTKI